MFASAFRVPIFAFFVGAPSPSTQSLSHHHHHEEELLLFRFQEDPEVVLLPPRVLLHRVLREDQDQVGDHAQHLLLHRQLRLVPWPLLPSLP